MMRYTTQLEVALLSLVLGISQSCTGTQPPAGGLSPESAETILLRVGTAGGAMIAGAEVLLVSMSGIEPLGFTDSVGAARIPRARVTAPGAHVLIICAEYHFCGALRLDHSGLLEGSDYFIALAPYAIH